MEWSSSGSHLVVVSTDFPCSLLRVSTFQGSQLVGLLHRAPRRRRVRFQRLHLGRRCRPDCHPDPAPRHQEASPEQGAGQHSPGRCGGQREAFRPGSPSGGWPPAVRSPSRRPAAHLLAHLHAGGGDQPAPCTGRHIPARVLVQQLGSQASVVLEGAADTESVAPLCRPVQQRVQHRMELPKSGGALLQGAHALVLEVDMPFPGSISVVAASGRDVGRELFSCPGSCAAWDALAGSWLSGRRRACLSLTGHGGSACLLAIHEPVFRHCSTASWLADSSASCSKEVHAQTVLLAPPGS